MQGAKPVGAGSSLQSSKGNASKLLTIQEYKRRLRDNIRSLNDNFGHLISAAKIKEEDEVHKWSNGRMAQHATTVYEMKVRAALIVRACHELSKLTNEFKEFLILHDYNFITESIVKAEDDCEEGLKYKLRMHNDLRVDLAKFVYDIDKEKNPYRMTDDSKFVLRWEINNATTTLADKKADSEVFSAGGFECPSDEAKIAYILECDHPLSSDWKCEAEFEYMVPSTKSNRTPRKQSFSLNDDGNKLGINSRFQWTDLFDIDNGYLNDDKIIVEFRINIMSSEVIPILLDPTKFCSPNEMGNVTIIIGENKVKVSKEYLAVHSPVFAAMFFGNFVEKGKEEIEIKDIVYKEFIDLLLIIFPGPVQIRKGTVKHILKLADRFQMEHVLNLSKMFLTQSMDINSLTKLLLADQYKFDSLRDHIIQSLSHEFTRLRLKSRPEWEEFSAETKAAINDRLATLMIKLIVVGQGVEVHFLVKYGASLDELKKSYADKTGISFSSLRFLFEGRRITRITDDDTPMSLEMADGDFIDVFQEQHG